MWDRIWVEEAHLQSPKNVTDEDFRELCADLKLNASQAEHLKSVLCRILKNVRHHQRFVATQPKRREQLQSALMSFDHLQPFYERQDAFIENISIDVLLPTIGEL